MSVTIIVGAQCGDEGKGKIVDFVSQQNDLIIRYQGGDNAGHTVVNDYGTFKLHLIPCGIFNPNATSLIGTGLVVNPDVLKNEIDQVKSAGIDTSRLFISDRAHVLMPYHVRQKGVSVLPIRERRTEVIFVSETSATRNICVNILPIFCRK